MNALTWRNALLYKPFIAIWSGLAITIILNILVFYLRGMSVLLPLFFIDIWAIMMPVIFFWKVKNSALRCDCGKLIWDSDQSCSSCGRQNNIKKTV